MIFFSAFGVMGFTRKASACGIDWKVPTNHFDGVNEVGEFSVWREAGIVDMGNDLKIPLIINFKPARGGNSWLGPGWLIPLLESNVVQVDERRFLLTQPDGVARRFWREEDKPTILNGQGNWAGTINNDSNTITLWADCGWKLVFIKGKISSITTPKNRTLTIVYINGRPMEIQEQGWRRLRVETDANNNITGITFGQKRVVFKIGERPRVNVIQGATQEANVIGGNVPSLQTSSLAENISTGGLSPVTKQTNYDFAVDEIVQPTVRITETPSEDIAKNTNESSVSNLNREHTYTWHPSTGRLLKADDWTYNIKPGKDRWANAATERINSKGQKEFWFLDKAKGIEIIEGLDGVRKEYSRYVSGPLMGHNRSITETRAGVTAVVRKWIYDDNARLIKLIEGDSTTEYEYDQAGHRTSAIKDGKKLWTKAFDANSFCIKEITKHGDEITRKQLPNGEIEETIISNGRQRIEYSKDNRRLKVVYSDGPIQTLEYSPKGFLLKNIRNNGIVETFSRGADGALLEVYRNGTLYLKKFTDAVHKESFDVIYSEGKASEIHSLQTGKQVVGEQIEPLLKTLIPIQ